MNSSAEELRAQLLTSAPAEGEKFDLAKRLIRIGTLLSAEKDLQKLISMITTEARGLTQTAASTLYLVDHEQNTISFFISDSTRFNQVKMKLTPESIAGHVGLTGQTLNIEDVYEIDPSLPYKFNKSFDVKSGFRTRSMLVFPLHRQSGDILGVLQLINKTIDGKCVSFDESDLMLARSLGSQSSVAIENTLLYKEIENLFDSFVRYSSTAIDARDPCTGGHSRRVAMYSVGLAMALNQFSKAQIREIYYAAWLHDIGKIGVREAVLTKANKLTDTELDVVRFRLDLIKERTRNDSNRQIIDLLSNASLEDRDNVVADMRRQCDEAIAKIADDFAFINEVNVPGFMTDEMTARMEGIFKKQYIGDLGSAIPYLSQYEFENLMVRKGNLTTGERVDMESHVQKTFEILKQIPFTKDLARVPEIAGKHHEKLDASGYPNRLPQGLIPTQVRILTIADIYDALVAQDRPYKKAMPVDKALKILGFEAKDGKLDKDLLQIFVDKEIYKMEEMPDLDFNIK